MDNAIAQAAADYAEKVLGKEGFHYLSAVVANCRMLAAELDEGEEGTKALHMDALIISAYLHNISTAEFGFPDHHLKSAELRDRSVPGDDFGPRDAETSGGSRWWVWVIVLALIVGGGYWYFHGRGTEAQSSQAGGAAGAGQGGGRRSGGGGPGGPMVVPVVVATAEKGNLPVYFNGLGTVTAKCSF